MDPSGNSLIFIQRDEPPELEYGGAARLEKLARAVDNARILREFKNDDRAAATVINTGLRKYGAEAPAIDRATALAALIELAVAMEEPAKIEPLRADLDRVPLTPPERERIAARLREILDLEDWRKPV